MPSSTSSLMNLTNQHNTIPFKELHLESVKWDREVRMHAVFTHHC